MDDFNLHLYGNLWRSHGDHDAGLHLIPSLQSPDPETRHAAQEYLADAGPRSIKLLQAAIASGTLNGLVAADSMFVVIDSMHCARTQLLTIAD